LSICGFSTVSANGPDGFDAVAREMQEWPARPEMVWAGGRT
jgi:hypothetical protein